MNDEIRVLQEELGYYLDEYEGLARRLEMFVSLLNKENTLELENRDAISLV